MAESGVLPFQAFAAAQGEFSSAIKDANNPFFKSKYADLSAIWDAVRGPLAKNGISVTQPIRITDAGAIVETIVRYKDGTVIETSQCPIISKSDKDPQALGSAITYARRYSLAAILCIVTDDDDAQGAAQPPVPAKTATPAPVKPAISAQEKEKLKAWQNEIDHLPAQPGLWTDHANVLRSLSGVSNSEKVALFKSLCNLAMEQGLEYNNEGKYFWLPEPVLPNA